MTNSQRLTIRLSEERSALNGLIEERNKLPDDQDPSAEMIRKIDDATKRIQATEVEFRAAMTQEAAEEERRKQASPDSEGREANNLLARASIIPFMLEATEDRRVEGAEAEVRSAILGDNAGKQFPIDLLMQPSELRMRAAPAEYRRMAELHRPPSPATSAGGEEHRVDTVTPVDAAALADGSQAPTLERVFTNSIAARLLVAMPSVPIGAANYPIMTRGTTAVMRADGATVDAGPAAFTGFTLEPIRLTARYLFNIRQTLQLSGFEEILRRDLSAVMSDKMDDQIVNGNGTAPNVNGFINELDVADAANAVTTWPQFLDFFTSLVDGLNSYNLGDLRAVVGSGGFTYANNLFRTGSNDLGPRESAYEYVRARIGGISVSSRIPAEDATSKDERIIVARTAYPGMNAVAPIWRGMELIRDPYTNAAEGQVALTAIMFFNFKILREVAWKQVRIKLSA